MATQIRNLMHQAYEALPTYKSLSNIVEMTGIHRAFEQLSAYAGSLLNTSEIIGTNQTSLLLTYEALPNIVKIAGIALPCIALFSNKDNKAVTFLKDKAPLIEKLDKHVSIEKSLNVSATLISAVSAALFAHSSTAGEPAGLAVSIMTGLAVLGFCRSLISEKNALPAPEITEEPEPSENAPVENKSSLNKLKEALLKTASVAKKVLPILIGLSLIAVCLINGINPVFALAIIAMLILIP